MLGTVTKDRDSLWAGVFVCESLGVLLLIFTLLEIMERMYVLPLTIIIVPGYVVCFEKKNYAGRACLSHLWLVLV